MQTLGTPAAGQSQSAYVLYAQATAQADAADALAQAQATAQEDALDSTAVLADTSSSGSASVQLASSTSTEQENLYQSETGYDNTLRDSDAEADAARSVTYAQDQEQDALSLAGDQQTYEDAIQPSTAGGGGESLSQAQSALTTAQQQAAVALTTGEAGADLTWDKAYDLYAANYADSDAGATKTETVDLAGDQKTYDLGVAQADATEANAEAQALTTASDGQPGVWDAQTAADNAQSAATAAADAAWQGASYTDAATALGTMAGTLSGTSAAGWAQFQSELAQTQQSWWGSSTSGAWQNTLANTAAVNAAYTANQQSLDSAYQTEVSDSSAGTSAAALNDATTDAAASVTQAGTDAAAEDADVVGGGSQPGTAAATQQYLDRVAQANHDYTVATANGASDASSALSSALASAQSTYESAMAADSGTLETALAGANVTYVDGTTGGADLTQTSTDASAQDVYTQAAANAMATLQNALYGSGGTSASPSAGLFEALDLQNAQSYQAAMDALAAAQPSAWANFAAAETNAAAQLVSSQTSAAVTVNQTSINDLLTQQVSDATAEKTDTDADDWSEAEYAESQAATESVQATAQQSADNLAAGYGQTVFSLPAGATAPTVSTQAVDAVIAADYGVGAPTSRYTANVTDLFNIQTSTASGNQDANWLTYLPANASSGGLPGAAGGNVVPAPQVVIDAVTGAALVGVSPNVATGQITVSVAAPSDLGQEVGNLAAAGAAAAAASVPAAQQSPPASQNASAGSVAPAGNARPSQTSDFSPKGCTLQPITPPASPTGSGVLAGEAGAVTGSSSSVGSLKLSGLADAAPLGASEVRQLVGQINQDMAAIQVDLTVISNKLKNAQEGEEVDYTQEVTGIQAKAHEIATLLVQAYKVANPGVAGSQAIIRILRLSLNVPGYSTAAFNLFSVMSAADKKAIFEAGKTAGVQMDRYNANIEIIREVVETVNDVGDKAGKLATVLTLGGAGLTREGVKCVVKMIVVEGVTYVAFQAAEAGMRAAGVSDEAISYVEAGAQLAMLLILSKSACFVAGTPVFLPRGYAVARAATEAETSSEEFADGDRLAAAGTLLVGLAGMAVERLRSAKKKRKPGGVDSEDEEMDSDPENAPVFDELDCDNAVREIGLMAMASSTAVAETRSVAQEGEETLLRTADAAATGAGPGRSVRQRKPSLARALCLAAFLVAAFLAAAYFGGKSLLPRGTHALHELPATSSPYATQSIETIRVGQRVLSHNPDSGRPMAVGETAVDPATWRHLTLLAVVRGDNGEEDRVEVETLQPPEWIAATHAVPGAAVPIPFDMAEMELPEDLQARVVANEPCPPIAKGPGRVVLTTVNHLNPYVFELELADGKGRSETVRPTGPHKFYSADRRSWVSVEHLRIGERVPGVAGMLTVASVHRLPGVHRVYNMTVEREHVYHVATLGALVHNNNCYSGPVYHGTDSASAANITENGLNADAWREAAGGAGPDEKGFSFTTNPDTALDWANARAAERDESPVVLQGDGSQLPLQAGGPGEWTDPGEYFIPPSDFGQVGPGSLQPIE